MTGPESRGRAPGPIAAALVAILLACVGVIVWDQTRTVDPAAAPNSTSAPAPSSAPAGGSSGGFGDLK